MADGGTAKTRLLEAALDHVTARGVGDVSLRQLAAALDTSHRMLIFHFGSKEGLLTELVRHIERRERLTIAALDGAPTSSPGDQMRRAWSRWADPGQWPKERLFFEVYVSALQGHPHALPLLDEAIRAWVEPMTALAMTHGLTRADATDEARLALAVVRGLLLDLLASGDREAVDAAMERHIQGFEDRVRMAQTRASGPEAELRS